MEHTWSGGDNLEFESDPATWSALEEKIFVDIMINEVKKGTNPSSLFSRSSCAIIGQEFYERTKKRHNHSQMRNKYNQLRINYSHFSRLLKEPGFNWDPVLGNAVATDAVWESYLKLNKKARRFRRKGFPMFTELGIIFGDTMTYCKDAYPLSQYPCVGDEKIDLENESTNATPPTLPIDSSSTGKDFSPETVGQRRQRSPSSTPTSHLHKNKESKTGVLEGECFKETVKAAVSNKQASEPASERAQPLKDSEACPQPSPFSITSCVKCLESMQDVDAATYIKAIKMFKDVDWREMFMAMSAQRRLEWLASLE